MKRCKVHTAAYTAVDKLVSALVYRPGGYTFWMSLPKKGRHNVTALRKEFAKVMLTTLFPATFVQVLLQSALTKEGQPLHNSPLYQWLLKNMYNDNVHELYKEWLKYKGR